MSFLWHGLTDAGTQVPIQVDTQGRVVAQGLTGPQGPEGPEGPQGPSLWSGSSPGNIYYEGGNVGIGTDAALELLTLSAVDNPKIRFIDQNDYSYKIGIISNNKFSLLRSDADTQTVTVDSSGNVGIGTETPEELLDVAGTGLLVQHYLGNSIRLRTTVNNGNDATFRFEKARGGQGGPSDVQNTDDLGEITWSGYFSGAYQSSASIRAEARIDGGVYGSWLRYHSDAHSLRTSNATRMVILPDGKVGIGTESPDERFHVVGNGFFTGSVSASNIAFLSSDPNHWVPDASDAVESDDPPEQTFTYVGPTLDLLDEIQRLEHLVAHLYKTLRLTPPAGWEVWDGAPETRCGSKPDFALYTTSPEA